MQSKWFSHLPKEEQEEFKQRVLQARDVLERLKEVMVAKEDSTTSVSLSDYDCPSWAYKQAHLNGYNQAIREILKYLDTTES